MLPRSLSTALLAAVPALALAAASCQNPQVFASEQEGSAAPRDARVFPYEVERHTFENGLKVILIPMPSDGLTSYWSIVRTGSRDEVEEGVTGFAHFFEHMMFRGSERFPDFDAVANGMGAETNAYTTDDYTAYHLSFASEDLETVVELEADRFQNLNYTEAQFKTEAGAVYGEYRKGRTNPFWCLFEGLQNAAFDQHTYKHTTIGFEADIAAMPDQFEYSQSFFRRFYRPENVVVMVVGDFERDATLRLLRENYASWQPGYEAPDVPTEPEQTAQRRVTIPFDGKTLPILAVVFKGERMLPGDRDMMAASLIGELAFGSTSDLYKKLVLEEQRVDAMFEDFGYNRDPNLWGVFARVKDPADVAAVEGEILATVARLRRELVDPEQLDDVRSRLKYGFLSGLTTPSEVAGGMARFVAITGDVACVDEMYTTLEAVTPEDVRRAAERWLVPERSTVAVLHTAGQALPDAVVGNQPPVLMPVPQDPNVAIRLWFQVGSQDDPAGKEGLASLTAAMISDGGTQKRTYEEVLEALFPLAGGYGASVDKEMTVVSARVHRDNVGPFYELFVDAVLRPGFRQEDFDRIRSQMVSSIENDLRYASDEELGKAALYGTVFAGTPYEHLVDGTVASLNALTLDDVRAFFAEHYTRDNLVVALGGAYDDGLLQRLQADLARLDEGVPPRVAAPEPAGIEGRHVVLVEKDGPSTAISFGYPIELHRGEREFYALWLANAWLGQHRNSFSHLYNVIRETRGMNYGDYSYIEAFPQGGRRTVPPTHVARRQQLFEVWVRPVPSEQAVFALRAALREVEKLARDGMTQEQFETAQAFMRKYAAHYAETMPERLGYAVDDRFYGIEEGHLQRLRRITSELTLEEVNAAIAKHLQTDDLVIAMVTADAAGLRDALVSDAPSPIDYGDVPKPDEVLAEDQEIMRHPLKVSADRVTIVPVEDMFAGSGPVASSSSR